MYRKYGSCAKLVLHVTTSVARSGIVHNAWGEMVEIIRQGVTTKQWGIQMSSKERGSNSKNVTYKRRGKEKFNKKVGDQDPLKKLCYCKTFIGSKEQGIG